IDGGTGSRTLFSAQLAQAFQLLGQQAALAEITGLGQFQILYRVACRKVALRLREYLFQILHRHRCPGLDSLSPELCRKKRRHMASFSVSLNLSSSETGFRQFNELGKSRLIEHCQIS